MEKQEKDHNNDELLVKYEELKYLIEELEAYRDLIAQKNKEQVMNFEMYQINEIIFNKANQRLKEKDDEIKKQKQEVEDKYFEILTQNEELKQSNEELIAQLDLLEQKNIELTLNNEKLQFNEKILKKSYQRLKEKDNEIKKQRQEIEEKNAEILAQNEELMQTQEELMTQHDFIEQKNRELVLNNERLQANEKILRKTFQKLKEKEEEIKLQKTELEEKNAEILTQNEELMQTQEELMTQHDFIEQKNRELALNYERLQSNEKILRKTFQKLKEKEEEIKLQKAELEEKNAEILTQNEELMQTQEELLSQREFIERQHKEMLIQSNKIKNSINSALLIQEAILPYEQKMKELLLDYFIIYRPKDVVSGDFWWLNEVNGKIYLACVDCTGHGVAGAFMTMIGNTLLGKTIIGSGIENPCDILESLHEEVQTLLRQKVTGNNNGMDMSLICLERGEGYTKVIFVGAKQSLYYIPKGEDVIKELKGDRKAIGGIQNSQITFTNQELYLKNGSWIYMGSDGLYDQNNVLRKKFGENLLKEILLRNHHLTSHIQKEELEKALDNHQQGTEQRDDILWIGIKL